MKNTRKMGLYVLFGVVVLTSLCLYADGDQTSSIKFSKPQVFSPLEGGEWVEQCVEHHPEILWLADSNVRKTEEGQATLQGTYSEQLFGEKYIEFDRTVMTIHCLKLILDGSDKAYLAFTAAQPLDAKLSRENFHELHLQGQKLLKSNWGGMSEVQMAEAMEAALVLGDMGKSEKARQLLMPYGIRAPDHDDFYGEAIQVMMQQPMLCPSFCRLSTAGKNLLLETANLAHYGHIVHLEGDLGMLSRLKETDIASKDPIALSFDLFVHTCDVAGALGHVNNQSSLVYTDSVHRALQSMVEAIGILSNPNKSVLDAYLYYLNVRATWLGFDVNKSFDRVLTRIGTMLRLSSLEEGDMLRNAFYKLHPSTRDRIASKLDIRFQYRPTRTSTYIPAVLVNLSNNFGLGQTKGERLSKAITIGLPFIERVLQRHSLMLAMNKIDANIPLNFNRVAGLAKISPHSLNKDIYIDQEGVVHLMPDRPEA